MATIKSLPTTTYQLTLSADEAEVIVALLGAVVGSGVQAFDQLADSMYDEFNGLVQGDDRWTMLLDGREYSLSVEGITVTPVNE